ncbi:MAG TPA: hypothetical protein DCX25_01555 [Candidatus Pacebacteria bacterium]|nr:MAG: hypothetical protein UX00_C0009G0028 [Microgenomates group bacterium GW2011_GWB1_45_17]KKU23278.1 MAG: hypothetical protein UX35_C0007G0016 [Microgenomates group bacterium GW2011_GWA1_46_15]KKU23447.1 MAG: hypothetical protein UX36_C0005G0028 [Microgenomates group bacterium GW2011_GWC1_46_15]HAV14991.1 hypothetical protein [Candidatus Paceibacterota bacterium]HCR11593.1 hypothetical protein [Candidatus Paceibacterota bacterium]
MTEHADTKFSVRDWVKYQDEVFQIVDIQNFGHGNMYVLHSNTASWTAVVPEQDGNKYFRKM